MNFNCLKIGDEYQIPFVIKGTYGDINDVVANISVTPDLQILNVASRVAPISTNTTINLGVISKNDSTVVSVKVAILSIENLIDDNYKVTLTSTTSTAQDVVDDTLSKNLHKEFNFFERCDSQISSTDIDPNYEIVNAEDGLRVQLREGFVDFGTSEYLENALDAAININVEGAEGYLYPCLITVEPVDNSGPYQVKDLISGNDTYSIELINLGSVTSPVLRNWVAGDVVTITCNGYSESLTVVLV
jgi:hypothetical protein